MAIRKNANNLTASEKTQLVNAIKSLKASGRYDLYVLKHREAFPNVHQAPAFLPWHRKFILDLESELQEASGNPNLGLPYWHWGENAALSNPENYVVWQDDLMGGNGDPSDNNFVKTGPFRQGEWETIDGGGNPAGPLTREFGVAASTLPTQTDIDNGLATIPYDSSPWNTQSNPSFRNRLEGFHPDTNLHNTAHAWVGGIMREDVSPNDPVFFLNHCFVDKLWADWQRQHPDQGYLPTSDGPSGHNLNDLMEATVYASVQPADVLDTLDLGYGYDTDPPPSPPTVTSRVTLEGYIKLDWNQVPNASGYKIYKKSESGGSFGLVRTINSGSTTSWTDTSEDIDLTRSGVKVTRWFKMRTFDVLLRYSDYSNIVSEDIYVKGLPKAE